MWIFRFKKNKFFIKNEENCPINDFYFDNKFENLKNYTIIPLNNETFFYYINKNVNNNIIIKLKLNEKNETCIHPDEISWGYNYIFEPSSKYCQNAFDNIYFDYRYKKIDTINKYKLYNENGIINSTNNLTKINNEILKNNSINLYQKSYIGIDKNCLKEKNLSLDFFEKLTIIQNKADSNINTIFYILFYFLLCFCML